MLSQRNVRAYARIAFAIGLVLAATLGSISASACVIPADFNEATIDQAQIIIRGRPMAYVNYPNVFGLAKLTFLVEETFRGPPAETWLAVWENSTFEKPDSLAEFVRRYGNDIVVGLDRPDWGTPMDAPSPAMNSPEDHVFWQLPWVVQVPCAPPFMGDYTEFESALRNRGVIE